MLNNVNLMGRLAEEPTLNYTTADNIPVLNFAIAVQRRVAKGKDKVVDFFRVVAWQSTAEFVATHFKKGQPICLEGCLQQRSWLDEATQTTRYAVEVVAESVHFAGFLKDNAQTDDANQSADFNPLAGAA